MTVADVTRIAFALFALASQYVAAQTCQTEKPPAPLEVVSYVGDCKNGLAHGNGLVQLRNLSSANNEQIRIRGEFHSGMPSGQVILASSTGRITFRGEMQLWLNWIGESKETLPDGSVLLTTYRNGVVMSQVKNAPEHVARPPLVLRPSNTNPQLSEPATKQQPQNKLAEALAHGLLQGLNRKIQKDKSGDVPNQGEVNNTPQPPATANSWNIRPDPNFGKPDPNFGKPDSANAWNTRPDPNFGRPDAAHEAARQKQQADDQARWSAGQKSAQADWANANAEAQRKALQDQQRAAEVTRQQNEQARLQYTQQEAIRQKQQAEEQARWNAEQKATQEKWIASQKVNQTNSAPQTTPAANSWNIRPDPNFGKPDPNFSKPDPNFGRQDTAQEAARTKQQAEEHSRWNADQKAAQVKLIAEQKAAQADWDKARVESQNKFAQDQQRIAEANRQQNEQAKLQAAQQKSWQQPTSQGWSNPPRTQQSVVVNTPNTQIGSTPIQQANSTYNQVITLPPPNPSFGNANSTPVTLQNASNQNTNLVIAAALISGAIFFAPEELIGASVISAYTQRRYVVYAVSEYGKIVYVGISSNFSARRAWHFSQDRIARAIEGLADLSELQAHSVEQVLIEKYGLGKNGGQLMNKINSIAKNNPKYKELVFEGKKLLNKVRWEGF